MVENATIDRKNLCHNYLKKLLSSPQIRKISFDGVGSLKYIVYDAIYDNKINLDKFDRLLSVFPELIIRVADKHGYKDYEGSRRFFMRSQPTTEKLLEVIDEMYEERNG